MAALGWGMHEIREDSSRPRPVAPAV
jgi:hypothetical protein